MSKEKTLLGSKIIRTITAGGFEFQENEEGDIRISLCQNEEYDGIILTKIEATFLEIFLSHRRIK